MQGALMGLAAALVMALLLAFLDYQLTLAVAVQNALIWVGAGVTALAAGWGAGRVAEAGGWFHGALAAVTLNLVSTVVAETIHAGNVTHLWAGLGVGLVVGLLGGILGFASQY
nr:TIGR04086 family membrane protein [Sulfobacillus harzensis]